MEQSHDFIKKNLIHIYILHKSGLPLFDYSFCNKNREYDSSLISGGIIGIINILRVFIKANKHLQMIDHGDRKIIFERNKTKEIIFALIVKEDSHIIRQKLKNIRKDFDYHYNNLLRDIKETCNITKKWLDLKNLIDKEF
ncbi:MAG: hypothetical protein ACFFAO_12160 [Candidatus Hermodarchaeota archaeon]